MTVEWMPVSPCQPDCESRDNYCPPKGRFGCVSYKEYLAAVDTQRKLLEYLIVVAKDTPTTDTRWIPLHELELMLKQLEAKEQ